MEHQFLLLSNAFSDRLQDADSFADGDPVLDGKCLDLEELLTESPFPFMPHTRLKALGVGFELCTYLDWPFTVIGLCDESLIDWEKAENLELIKCPMGEIPFVPGYL